MTNSIDISSINQVLYRYCVWEAVYLSLYIKMMMMMMMMIMMIIMMMMIIDDYDDDDYDDDDAIHK